MAEERQKATDDDGYIVIFRRYRHVKGGRVLDAHDYGLKAWPIRIKRTTAA